MQRDRRGASTQAAAGVDAICLRRAKTRTQLWPELRGMDRQVSGFQKWAASLKGRPGSKLATPMLATGRGFYDGLFLYFIA